jgi:hypothetical protein
MAKYPKQLSKFNLKVQNIQTTLETLKYQQQRFQTADFWKNVIKMLKPKVAKSVTISLGN